MTPQTTRDEYCVLILTHGRPNKQLTLKTLEKFNYNTDNVYFVVDNEDKCLQEYKEKYRDKVIIFDKKSAAKNTDTVDCSLAPRNAVVFARNLVFDIAEQLGYKMFLMLDDDYDDFEYIYDDKLRILAPRKDVINLDLLFRYMFDFLRNCQEQVKTVCFAQHGDFIGGRLQKSKMKLRRKAMNTFFCMTDRRFEFTGLVNEDVSAYVCGGIRGEIYLTIPFVGINQMQTQKNAGGLTDIYKFYGTLRKTMYSAIQAPESIEISAMGRLYPRAHHKIDYTTTIQLIIPG